MMFMIGGVLLAIFVGMVIGSVRRDREQAAKVRAVQDRLSERYRPEQLYVSVYDQSAVGLSFERGVVVLGDPATDAEYPFLAILEIEGVRDGAVLRRARREALDAPSATASGRGDVIRVNTLDLRITVDDPARPTWTVRLFDWPAAGVTPGNVAFQQRAREAEQWYALLLEAMRRSAA